MNGTVGEGKVGEGDWHLSLYLIFSGSFVNCITEKAWVLSLLFYSPFLPPFSQRENGSVSTFLYCSSVSDIIRAATCYVLMGVSAFFVGH